MNQKSYKYTWLYFNGGKRQAYFVIISLSVHSPAGYFYHLMSSFTKLSLSSWVYSSTCYYHLMSAFTSLLWAQEFIHQLVIISSWVHSLTCYQFMSTFTNLFLSPHEFIHQLVIIAHEFIHQQANGSVRKPLFPQWSKIYYGMFKQHTRMHAPRRHTSMHMHWHTHTVTKKFSSSSNSKQLKKKSSSSNK